LLPGGEGLSAGRKRATPSTVGLAWLVHPLAAGSDQ